MSPFACGEDARRAISQGKAVNGWQHDLLDLLTAPATCVHEVFERVQKVASDLGFDHVAYGFQSPYPVTQPRITLLNNYPSAWQEHYAKADYLRIDPTVAHARKSQAPVLWSERTFADTPRLWADARDHGLHVGWAQSSLDGPGAGSMLTLCRSRGPLTQQELLTNERHMRWLVQVTHVSCSRFLIKQATDALPKLSVRELEVLKWTADGKTAQEIADILAVSKHAVDFHLKNVVNKLQVSNKTSAVARAALNGLLT